jgi:hypothetical protein
MQIVDENYQFELSNPPGLPQSSVVAQKKIGTVNFRAPEALKKSFDRALETQSEFPSATAYFEDCMRALIEHARTRKALAMPLALLTPEEDEARRQIAKK